MRVLPLEWIVLQKSSMKGRASSRTAFVEGTVIELFPDDDYGYILTNDQREVRFHATDLTQRSFAGLRVGSPVRLLLATVGGEPRATNIEALGPHVPR